MKTKHKYKILYLKYILMLLCLFAAFTADCQGIYDRSFTDLNSRSVSIRDFAGKKILFIILPVNTTDSLAGQLKSFAATYVGKVQVIGVLSQEDGYSPDNNADSYAFYQNTGILITEVMSSRKGDGQSPLMKWLTNKNENGHFDMDVNGPGHKFFVNEQGNLYAVLGGNLSLTSPFINKIVNAPAGNGQAVPAKGKTKP